LLVFSIALPAIAETDTSGAIPPLRPPQVLQGSISLDDAQNIALNQNRDVLEASIEMRRSESLLRALITTRYPKILAIAFTGQQLTSYEGHYVRNTLALPGVFEPVTQQYRLSLQVRQAQAQLQITRERFRRANGHGTGYFGIRVFLPFPCFCACILASPTRQRTSLFLNAVIPESYMSAAA